MGGVRWREVLGGCASESKPVRSTHMIVDMCSESRSQSGGKAKRSVYDLARLVMLRNLKVVEDGGFLFNMYDNSARMHEERAQLWETRYKKKELSDADVAAARESGKTIVDGTAYAPANIPYTREFVGGIHTRTPVYMHRMWPSSHGKKKAAALFERACMEVAHGMHDHDVRGRTIVSWHAGRCVVYPYTAVEAQRAVAERCCSNTFGEADQKVSEAVKILAAAGTVCVKTVDSDMILQLIASPTAHTWHPVHLHMKNATMRVHDAVAQCGGNDYDRRLTCVFWILAAHGVDYCKSLVRFGFYAKELLRHAQPCGGGFPTAPLFVDGPTHGTKVLKTSALMRVLATVKRRNVKPATWSTVAEELQAMLFCVSLFTGAGANRVPCGGPVKTDIVVNTRVDLTACTKSWVTDAAAWDDVLFDVGNDTDDADYARDSPAKRARK